ncbi:MAG: hypothetical protein ACREVA_02460 [Burkholderiales bacterium]
MNPKELLRFEDGTLLNFGKQVRTVYTVRELPEGIKITYYLANGSNIASDVIIPGINKISEPARTFVLSTIGYGLVARVRTSLAKKVSDLPLCEAIIKQKFKEFELYMFHHHERIKKVRLTILQKAYARVRQLSTETMEDRLKVKSIFYYDNGTVNFDFKQNLVKDPYIQLAMAEVRLEELENLD